MIVTVFTVSARVRVLTSLSTSAFASSAISSTSLESSSPSTSLVGGGTSVTFGVSENFGIGLFPRSLYLLAMDPWVWLNPLELAEGRWLLNSELRYNYRCLMIAIIPTRVSSMTTPFEAGFGLSVFAGLSDIAMRDEG